MSSNLDSVSAITTGPAQAGPVFVAGIKRRDSGFRFTDWLGVAPFLIFALLFLILPTLFLISTAFVDKEGHFTFANLPDGDYYLIVEVAWRSPTGVDVGGGERIDGGAFGRRLRLRGGETRDVELVR